MPQLHSVFTAPASGFSSMLRGLRRQMAYSDRPALIALVALTLVLTVLGLIDQRLIPQTALLLPMFLGSLWLWPRSLPWFVVFCLCGVILLVAAETDVTAQTTVRVVVSFLIALAIMLTSFRRSRLGVSGPRGESMLVDLRDRINQQGRMPALPGHWEISTATKTAGGTQFAGDFIGASLSEDGQRLAVVVVDVSGKGVEAGTRALLLSGAFGGLVSALPREEFLPAANSYLLKQAWEEGFATAIHLSLDLVTGDFEVRKAGHPPALWVHAGSGSWSVLDSDGPALGLLARAKFEVVHGTMRSGDVLLLYTDGLVESTERDLSSGIDKLAGRGQMLLRTWFEDGARRIIDDIGTRGDDGAVVVVHRR